MPNKGISFASRIVTNEKRNHHNGLRVGGNSNELH